MLLIVSWKVALCIGRTDRHNHSLHKDIPFKMAAQAMPLNNAKYDSEGSLHDPTAIHYNEYINKKIADCAKEDKALGNAIFFFDVVSWKLLSLISLSCADFESINCICLSFHTFPAIFICYHLGQHTI